MSPLAHHQIAADPALELISTRPADAIALGAPEGAAPVGHASGPILDASLILSAFSPGTRRQLELTVNALSRTFRRAIRHAERLERDNAPFEEQDAAWKSVEHRSALLQDFLKSLSLPAPIPTPMPAAAAPSTAPQMEPEPLHPLVPAANQLPMIPPNALPPIVTTPPASAAADTKADLFAEFLAEFRRIRVLPTGCRAERRRKEQAGNAFIKKVNRQGDAFANRVYQAMEEFDAMARASGAAKG